MKNTTRKLYNGYLTQIAELNGVEVQDLSSKFPVEPSVEQKLEAKIQESAGFLKLINVIPVEDKSGQLLGLGVDSPCAGTTDTDTEERKPSDPTSMASIEYTCEQTNFDTSITYKKLDLWSKHKNFQPIIRDAILKRQALDRIMIGFNGTHRAKTSNKTQYKLLQDVNIGWLQKIRNDRPSNVMSAIVDEEGNVLSESIKVGPGCHYVNLDAVVMDAVDNIVAEHFQDDDELAVICGRKLLSDKYFPLVNKEQENSELLASGLIISQKRVGGLRAVRVPSFPANAMLITRLDNLSIYWQEGTRRRSIIDNPKRDRIENYESVNEAYVVEDYDCAVLIENIEIVSAQQAAQTSIELAPVEQNAGEGGHLDDELGE